MQLRRFLPRLPSAGALLVAFAVVACGGGGGNSAPRVVPTATPTTTPTTIPTAVPTTNAAAFVCPTSPTNGVAHEVGYGSSTEAATRHVARTLRAAGATPAGTTTLLAIRYDRSAAQTLGSAMTAHETAAGMTFVRELDFPRTNALIHVVAVPTSGAAAAQSALRSQAGVVSVGVTGARRYATKVTTPYFTTDPYFAGFTGSAAPYYETATIPGQWDMHAIGLESAFAYSQINNGSGLAANANALGTNAVTIAIIDTGEDQTHPELANKITRARCFISAPNPPYTQSTGTFTTDEDGHGTNVSGVAAAASNNGLGFVGAGGGVALFAYRVFPTPNDNCTNPSSTDSQCNSSTTDIAAAINDAVANGTNVISLSLGGDACVAPSAANPGGDSDPVEGAAIENAINAGVIVVAASGNNASTSSSVATPGCDTGVIAVGASALDDGQPNGSGAAGLIGGTTTQPKEYVASYSQAGSPTASYRSTGAWGIVAPGADPTGSNDADNLHWVANIWTSTPFVGSASDTSFFGECTNDYPNSRSTSGTIDCRTLIAGTSMSTPHVAGAAALILSATGGHSSPYQSPTMMKNLLCSTTDDIGATQREGCGRLNVYRAMATALHDASLP